MRPEVEVREPQVEGARLMLEVGDDNQRERYAAGLLPRQELLHLAREELFSPFAGMARWRKLDVLDVRHKQNCNRGEVRFATRAPIDMDADEWANYKSVVAALERELANPHGTLARHRVTGEVVIVEHYGACSVCRAEVVGCSASIRLTWAGIPLSREYAL